MLTGSAHPALAPGNRRAARRAPRRRAARFPDSEVSFQIDENIRGTDVFIIQPTSKPVDEHLVELCVMMDAFRRSSASRIIHGMIPYFTAGAAGSRKDNRCRRVPISAKLVANLLGAAGANRVLTMDLHKAQIQGFFDIPVDHLFSRAGSSSTYSRDEIWTHHESCRPASAARSAPGRYARATWIADLAIIDKRRSEDGTAEVMNVIGEVRGRVCVITDDIIDTAGTIQKAAQALKDNGASRVFASAVHGVLSGPAMKRIEAAPIDRLIVTNTIAITGEKAASEKIVVLSVARLLAQAIRSINEEKSVSKLFV